MTSTPSACVALLEHHEVVRWHSCASTGHRSSDHVAMNSLGIWPPPERSWSDLEKTGSPNMA